MAGKTKALRCAIYTRKSSEEGLEQEFNSLDAQREACEAYILSQRHEGWTALSDAYDDGGFSGGTMERPAMQRLLTEVASGRVDIVVVYKVDRLTRSLADFAKIVELFDGQGISFVSVTQQFNTTTSMGRLTLNVLLSFAQFEREVTGERIRDKFLASRRKGMWMGGHPPLGYDLADRRLAVNAEEAALVRHIFAGYAEGGCVRSLKEELDRRGAVSKRRTSNAGITYGGKPFTRGALYRILANRTYLGEAVHKGESYPGEHDAIIDRSLWDDVHRRLDANRVRRANGSNAKESSLLAGLIYDDRGQRLTPSHATKGGRRYRYYVTPAEGRNELAPQGRAWRIPADEIEERIRTKILAALKSTTRLDEILDLGSLTPEERLAIYRNATRQAEALEEAQATIWRSLLASFVRRIIVRPDAIDTEIIPSRFKGAIHQEDLESAVCPNVSQSDADEPAHTIRIDVRLKRCGGQTRLVLLGDGQQETLSRPDPDFIKAVASAHVWVRQLIRGEVASIAEIALREGLSRSHASRLLDLAFLSPDIVEAILEGRQPPGLNVKVLTRRRSLPLCWKDQRHVLGFS